MSEKEIMDVIDEIKKGMEENQHTFDKTCDLLHEVTAERDRLVDEVKGLTAERDKWKWRTTKAEEDAGEEYTSLRALCDQGNTALAEMREERNEYRTRATVAEGRIGELEGELKQEEEDSDHYCKLVLEQRTALEEMRSKPCLIEVVEKLKLNFSLDCPHCIATDALDHSTSSEPGDTVAKHKHCSLGRCVKKHGGITCHPDGVACEYYVPREPKNPARPVGDKPRG